MYLKVFIFLYLYFGKIQKYLQMEHYKFRTKITTFKKIYPKLKFFG